MTTTADWPGIIKEHSPGLYALALHMLKSRSDAEDITQETFLRAFVATERKQLRVHTSMRAWLSKIAVNLCYDRLRRRSWHEIPVGDDGELVGNGSLEGAGGSRLQGPSPEEETLRLDDANVLRGAVADLPPNQRVAVVLRYSQDLTYSEIASVLGVPENTVATWLRRAHMALRRKLEKEEPKLCRATAHA